MDLERTLRALAPRLLRYCRVKLRDRDLADDVAQESLAALVSRWQRHGPPESAEAFVFAIARRRAARTLVRRRLWVPIEAVLGRRDNGSDPEQEAIARSDREWTYEALGRLPGHEREALLLVVLGGLTTADAGRALGVSPSAVKMRMARARERLATHWERCHVETTR